MNRDATGLAGARHIEFDTLGSTNAEALKRARTGERGPLWITARTQSAGRGRRGSTMGLAAGQSLRHAAAHRTIAGPAWRRSFRLSRRWRCMMRSRECAPQLGPALKVKWPNDLLLGAAKLAGILIEAESEPVLAAAVGIGVNCASHPGRYALSRDRLAVAGAPVTPGRAVRGARGAMQARVAAMAARRGFAAIRAAWLKRAAGLGEPIQGSACRNAS